MQNEILNQRILRLLRNGPAPFDYLTGMSGASDKATEDALAALMAEGKVAQFDDYRYELASGGYCPDPGPEVA